MEWSFIEDKPHLQIDEVGNIVQINGGVQPKACQKCKNEFKSKIKENPKKQIVPFYKCEDCDFENGGAPAVMDHKFETDHKIKKISKDRIVSIERTIEGSVAHISKTKDDVIILCDKCNAIC